MTPKLPRTTEEQSGHDLRGTLRVGRERGRLSGYAGLWKLSHHPAVVHGRYVGLEFGESPRLDT